MEDYYYENTSKKEVILKLFLGIVIVPTSPDLMKARAPILDTVLKAGIPPRFVLLNA